MTEIETPIKRPYKGPADATSKPIMSRAKLERIIANLKPHARNHALFVLGVETAFRAGDLLSLKLGDARDLAVGDLLTIREQKTKNRRVVTINQTVFDALQPLLIERSHGADDDALFIGEIRGTPLCVRSFSRMVKQWCSDVGLKERGYSAHTLRKTFGYMNRRANVPIDVLQNIYGHSSSKITQTYIAIQPEEIKAVYARGVL